MLKCSNIHIISYLGTSNVEKRLQIHDRQLDWAHSQNLSPIVYAQHYTDDQYRNNVTYIKNNGMLHRQTEARNILLEHFYKSDDDFAVFADNDCYLYQGSKYGYNDTFIKTFTNIPLSNLEHIDLFTAINPKNQPFTKDFAENAKLYEDYWRFTPNYIASGLFVLKNLKKHYDMELYFDNNFIRPDRSIIACEDQDFPIQLIHKNLGTYTCNNIVMKEEGSNTSTWTVDDKLVRQQKTTEGHDFISKKFDLPIQKQSPKGSWMRKFKQLNTNLKSRNVKLTEIYDNNVKNLFEGLL